MKTTYKLVYLGSLIFIFFVLLRMANPAKTKNLEVSVPICDFSTTSLWEGNVNKKLELENDSTSRIVLELNEEATQLFAACNTYIPTALLRQAQSLDVIVSSNTDTNLSLVFHNKFGRGPSWGPFILKANEKKSLKIPLDPQTNAKFNWMGYDTRKVVFISSNNKLSGNFTFTIYRVDLN